MKSRTALSTLALLAALAAPLPAQAQVNLPPNPHALGIARETLEPLWCAQLFFEETYWAEDDDEAEDYYDDGVFLDAQALDALGRDGIDAERTRALRTVYENAASNLSLSDTYWSELWACNGAFSGIGADGPYGAALSTVPDFVCAVAYWIYAAFTPGEQALALQLAEFAIGRHQQADPGEDTAAIQQQVMATGQARRQRIQQGSESAEPLQAELIACSAQYGFRACRKRSGQWRKPMKLSTAFRPPAFRPAKVQAILGNRTAAVLAAGLVTLTLVFSAPAYGRSWDVLADPTQNRLGQSYCMLWYGESGPMMQFTIRDDGAHFIVMAADEFSGATQQGEATFRVPSGEILVVGYNTPQPGVILSGFTRTAFEQFLHHFENPGEFYISVGGQRVHFPVADMGPMISTLRQCADALS